MGNDFWAGFAFGMFVGVAATIGTAFIVAMLNWILADHDRT